MSKQPKDDPDVEVLKFFRNKLRESANIAKEECALMCLEMAMGAPNKGRMNWPEICEDFATACRKLKELEPPPEPDPGRAGKRADELERRERGYVRPER